MMERTAAISESDDPNLLLSFMIVSLLGYLEISSQSMDAYADLLLLSAATITESS